jgi:NAD(P)-dependent dehydrogenase (short-subunit alcohol dehydrogenase family)
LTGQPFNSPGAFRGALHQHSPRHRGQPGSRPRTRCRTARPRRATVYAAARNPDQVDLPGATPIALDITDPASVAAAAQATGDVTVLINNAGSSTGTDLLTGDLDNIPWPQASRRSTRSCSHEGRSLRSLRFEFDRVLTVITRY